MDTTISLDNAVDFLTRLWILSLVLAPGATLVLMLIKQPASRMERATTGLMASFFMVMAYVAFLLLTPFDGLDQPRALIFWTVALALVVYYLDAFRRDYLDPALGSRMAGIAVVLALIAIAFLALVSMGL